MRILISGSNGLVGKVLTQALQKEGHTLAYLVRYKADPGKGQIYFDSGRGSIDKPAIEHFAPDAVIHLAGENIADGRWTESKKAKIRDSRIKGTEILAQALCHLPKPPKVWICASATGFYGSRGDEVLTEASVPGHSFLSEVCEAWEAAAQPATQKGIRVVNLRFGLILSKEGGGLKKLLFPFRLGLGGIIGNGHQYMSWIDLDDAVGVIQFALSHDQVQGPVNAVAPHPVTNREFTKTLGRVLLRPTCLPLPASTARMVIGEMADELLLPSTRVEPVKLDRGGYGFRYPTLKESLRHQLSGK